MRILLLHPDDVPLRGEWSNSRWDLIVDLGFAGASVYEEWSRKTGSRVITLYQFEEQEGYRRVKRGLTAGHGKLLDRIGLDWWEILAPCAYQEQQAIYLVTQLGRELGAGPIELVATRAHPHARLLSLATGWPVRNVVATPSSWSRLVPRVVAAAQDLRPSQMLEIAFDKWDPSYHFRSRVTKFRRARLKEPVVLLPSAYSNVTRVQLAYAAQLRNRRFLLATTRRSGESRALPANVDAVSLSAYAGSSIATKSETAELITAWNRLKRELGQVEDLHEGFQACLWDYFPPQLETGLRLRDAWRSLLSSEPVTGVLCGDDLNYHTRLPLILAQSMGHRAVYCSHGALDGGVLFKKSYADLHLVKGEMERDYVLKVSDIEPERVQIAAPEQQHEVGHLRGPQSGEIVLFSQPYEVSGGRAGEIYREILSPLIKVARQLNRRIVVKLHPFESARGRGRLLRSLLSADELDRVKVSAAPASEILVHTFLAIGLDSSVAVECTQRGIPYFMCGWLDFNGFGYMRQFARFGAGSVLEKPQDILSIPQRIAAFERDGAKIRPLWQAAANAVLDQILFGTECAHPTSASLDALPANTIDVIP
jgi:hypothetical protein